MMAVDDETATEKWRSAVCAVAREELVSAEVVDYQISVEAVFHAFVRKESRRLTQDKQQLRGQLQRSQTSKRGDMKDNEHRQATAKLSAILLS
jgi:hypothetical protein